MSGSNQKMNELTLVQRSKGASFHLKLLNVMEPMCTEYMKLRSTAALSYEIVYLVRHGFGKYYII